MPTSPLPEFDAYVTYARSDGLQTAQWMVSALKGRSRQAVHDASPSSRADTDLTVETENAIERSRCLVVCVTAAARLADPRMRREIAAALALRKPIYVARFEDVVTPQSVADQTRFDFFRNRAAEFERLTHYLVDGKTSTEPGARVDPFLPYLKALYLRLVAELRQVIPSTVEGEPAMAAVSFYRGTWAGGESDARYFASLGDAYNAYEGRMILLGEPGAGKTTSLLSLARDAVAARIDNMHEPLPLWAPVSAWDAHKKPPIIDWLAARERLHAQALRQAFADQNVLMLLDGLDELVPPFDLEGPVRLQFLEMLNASLGRNRVVLSCRVREHQQMGQTSRLLGVTTLLPPDSESKRTYLQATPQLAQAIDTVPVLQTLTDTPLTLAIFRAAYAGSAATLRTLIDLDLHTLRDKMLTAYAERRYAEATAKRPLPMSLQELRGVLSELAYRSAAGAPRSHSPGIVRAQDLTLMPDDWRTIFVEVATGLRLLVPNADSELRFPHLLWRDYFAYPLAVARLREHDPATRRQAIEVLGQINDDRVIPPLVVMLGDGDGGVQDRAAHILRQLGTSAIPTLLRGLNAPNERIRLQAKLVLATMPGPEGKEALRKMLASGG